MQRITNEPSDKILIALALMECTKARNLDIAWVDDRPMNQLSS